MARGLGRHAGAEHGGDRQPHQPIARGCDGVFLPTEIAWVVERSFAWISFYRRMSTIFGRTAEHLIAFIEIAFVSILARGLKRLAPQAFSA
ncbi:hypothetical protein ACCD06_21670 [Azospirillum sp. CT11-132]|jgi:putative transposase|uniref:transposase n=1 Tax=unclassified Azospirillum TaxID=2630922 RepID=UPI00145BE12F|nr:transposase [Azospirillum sp. TSA2s]